MTDGNLIFKSRTEQRIEAEYGLDIADVLRDLRVHRTTVVDLMKRYAIATGYNKSGTAA
jgi:hypothetical protein